MKLLRFTFNYAPKTVLFIGLISFLSGLGSTALVALISAYLAELDLAVAPPVLQFAGLLFLVFVTNVTAQILSVRLLEHATYDLYTDLSKRILSAPLRSVEQVGIDRLLAVFTHDIAQIAWILMRFGTLFVDSAVVIACTLYLVLLSPTTAILVGGIAIPTVLSFVYFHRKGVRSLRQARQVRDEVVEHYRALLEGFKKLKLHQTRREDFMSEQFDPATVSLRENNIRAYSLYAVATSWNQIIYFLLIGLILFGIGQGLGLDAELLLSYAFVFLYMRTAVLALLKAVPHISTASVSLQKLEDLQVALPNESERLSEEMPLAPLYSIGLSQTMFSYQRNGERPFTLGPVDLDIGAGEMVFIVGGNGSGKSTLAKILTGLYVPDTGHLCLNGEAVKDSTREDYRKYVSAIFSDFYLFEQLLGLSDFLQDHTAQHYLEKLQLDHKIQIDGGRFSSVKLSRGQRKRLALLTVVLEDREFYVFDEWAADQDPAFKQVFYEELLPELHAKGKTIVVISHDDHYYHVADRVIKLVDGRVLAEG